MLFVDNLFANLFVFFLNYFFTQNPISYRVNFGHIPPSCRTLDRSIGHKLKENKIHGNQFNEKILSQENNHFTLIMITERVFQNRFWFNFGEEKGVTGSVFVEPHVLYSLKRVSGSIPSLPFPWWWRPRPVYDLVSQRKVNNGLYTNHWNTFIKGKYSIGKW